MNILLGLTGSVATKIAPKIIEALEAIPNCSEVRVIMTDKAAMFYNPEALARVSGVKVYTEGDEWTWRKEIKAIGHATVQCLATDKWEKGLPIQHIELVKWASCLVIAPATANTIGKMANGLCDNLLTSVFTAWDRNRPVIMAPAMNTMMLHSPAVVHNMETLQKMGVLMVPTVKKELACGDTGDGALADASDIARVAAREIQWLFPFNLVSPIRGIPVGSHPGAFGAMRKHDRHCGVDLYCNNGTPVVLVEDGRVVSIEPFTGKDAGCPWWLDTKVVKVEGASGVVCYGEIEPRDYVQVGKVYRKGCQIGNVIPVLKPEKHRPDIPGHSCCMLHLQMFSHGTYNLKDEFNSHEELPDYIIDPTPYLLGAVGAKDIKKLDVKV